MDTSSYDDLDDEIMMLAGYLLLLRPPPFPWRTIIDVALARRLASRMESRGRVWSAVGLVGIGMLVGAGVVVMAVPRVTALARDRLRRAQPVSQG